MKLAYVLLSAWAAAAAASKQPGRSSTTFNFEVCASVFPYTKRWNEFNECGSKLTAKFFDRV